VQRCPPTVRFHNWRCPCDGLGQPPIGALRRGSLPRNSKVASYEWALDRAGAQVDGPRQATHGGPTLRHHRLGRLSNHQRHDCSYDLGRCIMPIADRSRYLRRSPLIHSRGAAAVSIDGTRASQRATESVICDVGTSLGAHTSWGHCRTVACLIRARHRRYRFQSMRGVI
jgi:hypothetical protein